MGVRPLLSLIRVICVHNMEKRLDTFTVKHISQEAQKLHSFNVWSPNLSLIKFASQIKPMSFLCQFDIS